ncbi:MAG: hypothetical protein ABMB14_11190 [Myxococcota bacterium]
MNRIGGLVALGACLWSTDALAGDWSSFSAAFPLLPCQDGWMGCVVYDQHVDPELRRDAAGRAIPADARIGWFDLTATAAFSPFAGLSSYDGDSVAAAEAPEPDPAATPPTEPDGGTDGGPDDRHDAVASVEDDRAEQASIAADNAAANAEAARMARQAAQREAEEAAAKRKEADAAAVKQRQQEELARKAALDAQKRAAAADQAQKAQLDREAAAAAAKASEMEQARQQADAAAEAQRKAEDAARVKAEAEEKRRQDAERQKLAAEEAAKVAAAAKEQKAAEERARLEALKAAEVAAQAKSAEEARLKAEKAAAASNTTTTVVTPAVQDAAIATAAMADTGDCADLVKLEPFASLGKLEPATTACLETRLANAPKMTDKKKISGILMADAWAKGDKDTWETLIKRHLDEIDQSDPDLCYKYALHLSRQGPGRASGVIRWANVALENRMVWIGDTYTSRVYSLYKVRAAASQSLWMQAEDEHKAAPTDETRQKVEQYRNMTKVNAREWYEYAKSSGKDATTAQQLCMSAAGTADYCEAG